MRLRLRLVLPLIASLGIASPAPAQVQVPTGFTEEVVRGGLNEPTSFAFLPDGRALVVEQRTGFIRLVVHGEFATHDPVLQVPEVESAAEERGLLGITVDPRWPVYPYVYLMHNRVGGTMRILRYLASDDVDDPNGQNLTLSAPRTLIDDIVDLFGNHNAGCLRFGPDGCLYASLGDDAGFCLAADSTTLRGEILRMRVDALPIYGGPMVRREVITPPDNPFAASPDSNARLVYAYGLRNPFRFHIDPADGQLFVGDVGEGLIEEMDQVFPGDFLGWPWREGDLVRDRPECPEPGGVGTIAYRSPIAVIPHGDPIGYAIISAGVYRPVVGGDANWPPEYYANRGDVFFSQYYDGRLRRIQWNGSSWVPAAPVPGQPDAGAWASGLWWAADFQVGPDGSLWWLSQFNEFFDASSGALHRIRYTGPPTAVPAELAGMPELRAAPNPSRGATELSFSLTQAGPARLAIYDLAGRRLAVPHDGWTAAGTTRVRWDGADERGRVLGPGVYFARLEREGASPRTLRLLRLR